MKYDHFFDGKNSLLHNSVDKVGEISESNPCWQKNIILFIFGSMQTMPLEYPKEYVDC